MAPISVDDSILVQLYYNNAWIRLLWSTWMMGQSQAMWNFQEEILITSAATYPIMRTIAPTGSISICVTRMSIKKVHCCMAMVSISIHWQGPWSPNITLISVTLCLPLKLWVRSTMTFSDKNNSSWSDVPDLSRHRTIRSACLHWFLSFSPDCLI